MLCTSAALLVFTALAVQAQNGQVRFQKTRLLYGPLNGLTYEYAFCSRIDSANWSFQPSLCKLTEDPQSGDCSCRYQGPKENLPNVLKKFENECNGAMGTYGGVPGSSSGRDGLLVQFASTDAKAIPIVECVNVDWRLIYTSFNMDTDLCQKSVPLGSGAQSCLYPADLEGQELETAKMKFQAVCSKAGGSFRPWKKPRTEIASMYAPGGAWIFR